MKEGDRARGGGGSLTRACNFLSINLPLFDVGFDISTSGNDTTLCTGSHTISDTTIRGITLHLYAGEHIDAGLYIFNRDFN